MGFLIGVAAVLVVVVLAAVVLMARKKKKSRPAANADVFRSLLNAPETAKQAPDTGGPEIEKLRQNLRVKLLYQEDKIDHAIEFERERNPAGTQAQFMRAAIERWERDNR